MSNDTVRANAQAMPRRLFLAAGPAAAVFATLRGAKASSGPSTNADAGLFALVEQGKHWWKQIGDLSRLCESVAARNEGREVLPEHEEALDEAQGRYQDAFDEAMSMPPQTVAGMRAMLEWIEIDCGGSSLSGDYVHMMVESFLDSPTLAVGVDL